MDIHRLVAMVLISGLFACEDIPRDPDGTAARVMRLKQFEAGIVSGSDPVETAEIVDRIETITGAQAAITSGETSILIDRLKQGRIDLIVGSFAQNSPLKKSVTFSAPLNDRKVSPDKPVTRAAIHPGENRWIMLVEKAIARP